MGNWASKDIRKQRETIIIEKHLCGWRVTDIASYIGISSGTVSNVIKKHISQGENNVPITRK